MYLRSGRDKMLGLSDLNRLAGTLGYPLPLRAAINAAPVSMTLNVDGKLGRNLLFNGDIDIAENVLVEDGVKIRGTVSAEEHARIGVKSQLRGDISLGRYCNLVQENWVRGEVTIGGFCAIAPLAAFQAKNHDLTSWTIHNRFYRECFDDEPPIKEEPIEIGSDVWIGRDALVLPGVTIGHGATVGAGAVVTHDVKPYEVVGGVPAEHISWRFGKETRERFLETQWWEWELTKIREQEPALREMAKGNASE